MNFKYRQYDNIFDIESLDNFYLDSHYFPAQNSFDIYYLSNVTEQKTLDRTSYVLKNHPNLETYIKDQILKLVPFKQIHKHNPKFTVPSFHFYNLRQLWNVQRYCRLFGIAPNFQSAINYIHENKDHTLSVNVATNGKYQINGFYNSCKPYNITEYNRSLTHNESKFQNKDAHNLITEYYPIKKTDPGYDPDKFGQGLMLGYNSNNYDLTMIASILANLISTPYGINQLNLGPNNWQADNQYQIENKHDILHDVLNPKVIRNVNDALFSPTYIKNMTQYLLLPSYDSKTGQNRSFFDRMKSTKWYIHKGWMQSNRFLDVSDLNEHMNMVSLKRLECILGLQVKESKNVLNSSSNKLVNKPEALAQLIAYNLNDVFATTIVFQQPVYQDAFNLRNILLKKYPQLIYSWDADNVRNRLITNYQNDKTAIINKHKSADNIKNKNPHYTKASTKKFMPLKFYNVGDVVNGIPVTNNHLALLANETLQSYNKRALENNEAIENSTWHNLPQIKKLNQKIKHVKSMKNFQLRQHAVAEDVHIAPDNLNFTRINSDASSQKFISHVIAPYHAMTDWPYIDYTYPDERVLKQIRKSTDKATLEKNHIPKQPVDVIKTTYNWARKQDKKFANLAKKRHRKFYHYGKNCFKDKFPLDYQSYQDLHPQRYNNLKKRYGLTAANPQITVKNGPIAHSFWPIFNYYYELEGCNTNQDLKPQNPKLKPKEGLTATRNSRGELVPVGHNVDANKLANHFNLNSFYINPDGTESTCTLNFSIGGLHGVEIKLNLYKKLHKQYEEKRHIQKALELKFIKRPQTKQTSLFSSSQTAHSPKSISDLFTPKNIKAAAHAAYLARAATVDGKQVNTRDYVSGSGRSTKWKNFKEPKIYQTNKRTGKTKIRKKYTYISVGPCQHEDFSGYYPLLISKIGIFWPFDQKRDVYKHIYHERLHLKAQLKKYPKNSHKWNVINQNQLLRKLLLNSASGAGGATFPNNIKKNNAILTMRILGQLFAWRIGEAETLADGLPHSKNPINRGYPRVPSTNTDGMYVLDIPPKLNNKILAKNVASMMLDISPVPLYRFVSKDANNRAEIENHGSKEHPKPVLTEAHGSNLTSWQGPSPVNRLSHPAVCDCVLAHYLAYEGQNNDAQHKSPCDIPLNLNKIANQLKHWKSMLDPDKSTPKQEFEALQMFQWQIVSGLAKHRYPYLEHMVYDQKSKSWKPNNDWNPKVNHNWETIMHTNRVYLINNKKDGSDNTFMKLVTNREIKKPSIRKRKREYYSRLVGKLGPNNMDLALQKAIIHNQGNSKAILKAYHYTLVDDAKAVKPEEGTINKISNMPENQNVCIITNNLRFLSYKQLKFLSKNIDIKGYLKIITHAFYNSWYNPNQISNKLSKNIKEFLKK